MNFNLLQTQILKEWQDNNTFVKSNEGKSCNFSFYDGPPFATGEPHYGHLLAGTIKDVVCRYHSMNGKKVTRRFGWDCHGLPLENQAQKHFDISSFKEFSKSHNNVVAFNDKCRELINNCKTSWEETSSLLGRWIDFDNCYRTMDPSVMESVWWAFKQIYNQGRIVKDNRIMPYSPKLQTSVSNSEASYYKEVQDMAVYVSFNVKGYELLVYTTTPWTLPMNSGLCVNKDLKYSLVNDKYIVATNLVDAVFNSTTSVKDFNIRTLVGQPYNLLSNYFGTTGKVVEDSFVNDVSGTGIVHIAPAYGEDDLRVAKLNQLEIYEGLDDECKFLPVVSDFVGRFCKDLTLIDFIINKFTFFETVYITHNYPYCERTGMPLIYRLQSGWIMKLDDVKDRLLENNKQINWVPSYVGENRFHNWLLESKDWNISRRRLWGTPLPLWISDDGDILCIGSLQELNALHDKEPVTDLHKEHVDNLVLYKNYKVYRRVPEVLDCWFESGCMPYGQLHYPFENKELFDETFPADFIAEGLDQTRGWFYSLLVIGTLLFDKAPFKNVIVNGMILAEDGQKMSKSKKNYPNPSEMLNTYGSDAVRAYLCSSASTQAMPTKFSEEHVKNVNKNLVIPIINSCAFYMSHLTDSKTSLGLNDLDYWILKELNDLTDKIKSEFDSYKLSSVVNEFTSFIDKLNNWYIRNSRKNLSCNDDSFYTLKYVLVRLSKLMAPIMPFVSEHLFKQLTDSSESVHLQDFPKVELRHPYCFDMNAVQKLTSMLNNFKVKNKLSLNSRINSVLFFNFNLSNKEIDLVKQINHVLNFESKSDIDFYVKKTYSPNYKTLGKKLGNDTKAAVNFIASLQDVKSFPINFMSYEINEEDLNMKVSSINDNYSFYQDGNVIMLIENKL